MIMLPLQGDGGEKSSATRRYLKITDFEDGRASAGHGIEFFEKRMQDDENAGPRDDADSGNMEVVVEEEEEGGGAAMANKPFGSLVGGTWVLRRATCRGGRPFRSARSGDLPRPRGE